MKKRRGERMKGRERGWEDGRDEAKRRERKGSEGVGAE